MRKETRSIGFVGWWSVFLSVILAVTVMGSGVYAQEQKPWTGNVNVFIGGKFLDEDDWEPVEEQFEFGLQIDFRPVDWPINLAADISHSRDEGSEYVLIYDPWFGYIGMDVDLEATTTEVNLGIRYIYEELPYVRPFIGGGPALIWVDTEGTALGITVSDDDWGLGFWIGGGAYVTLAKHFNLGAQVRYSWAKVELFDEKFQAGGWHLGGLVGFHW